MQYGYAVSFPRGQTWIFGYIYNPCLSVYIILQHPELQKNKVSACHPFLETHTGLLQAPGGDRGQELHPAGMLLICNRYLRQSAWRHAWQNPISCPRSSVIDLLLSVAAIAPQRSFNHPPAKTGCQIFLLNMICPQQSPHLFMGGKCWRML